MTTEKRAADLQPGDLTNHAGGSCDGSCADNQAPWRVEEIEPFGDDGVWVTWKHTVCGVLAQPCPCHVDCLLTFFGRA